mgnify:CR=1 FL=1
MKSKNKRSRYPELSDYTYPNLVDLLLNINDRVQSRGIHNFEIDIKFNNTWDKFGCKIRLDSNEHEIYKVETAFIPFHTKYHKEDMEDIIVNLVNGFLGQFKND